MSSCGRSGDASHCLAAVLDTKHCKTTPLQSWLLRWTVDFLLASPRMNSSQTGPLPRHARRCSYYCETGFTTVSSTKQAGSLCQRRLPTHTKATRCVPSNCPRISQNVRACSARQLSELLALLEMVSWSKKKAAKIKFNRAMTTPNRHWSPTGESGKWAV